ncbi:MAG: aminopeptidase P N-terminal domain-containing protein [Candidatus Microsaccharimonas sp.]
MTLAKIYQERRLAVSGVLPNKPIVISAFSAMQQTNDSAGPFVQESNFFWLTGITEPDWQLIIFNKKSWLVAPEKTDIQRIFDGGLSNQQATAISGVSDVVSAGEYRGVLENLAVKSETVFTILKHPHAKYFDFVLNPAIQKTRNQLKQIFKNVEDCRLQLARLKAIKSEAEIASIQSAIDSSIVGFEAVRKLLKTAKYEYQLEAQLSYSFRFEGTDGHAYQPIVGTEKNACTLHYIENNDPLPVNGTVLIDAGARVNGYAADITRTYAIGKPSQREKDVHREVEKAHRAIIELIQPGTLLKDYQEAVDVIMKQALKNLGLLKKPSDYRRYFPHAISHGLGIDVHDSLGGYDSFQPGMVLTVEPGIYIPEESIGVRIEDDILVTDDGHRNLSAALPTSL